MCMYVYVCMYVNMYVCMYVNMYVCMYVCMCIHMYNIYTYAILHTISWLGYPWTQGRSC